jgi:hypothetical protein
MLVNLKKKEQRKRIEKSLKDNLKKRKIFQKKIKSVIDNK